MRLYPSHQSSIPFFFIFVHSCGGPHITSLKWAEYKKFIYLFNMVKQLLVEVDDDEASNKIRSTFNNVHKSPLLLLTCRDHLCNIIILLYRSL